MGFTRSAILLLNSTGGAASYSTRVIETQAANLIQYFRMNETSGATAVDSSPEANNGSITGAELANAAFVNGDPVSLFDGTNDFYNAHSAGFNTDFDENELTLSIWAKVLDANVWSDATQRDLIRLGADAANNFVGIRKDSANNRIVYSWVAGGAAETVNLTISDTDWNMYTITVSKSNDRMIAYVNGEQTGATQTGLGVWSGALAATRCCVGARITTPTNVWSGWLAHYAAWKVELSAAEILTLATV